jgi:hypothetical protein
MRFLVPVVLLLAVGLRADAPTNAGAQLPPAVTDRDAHVAQLAIETAQRGPVTPIPLIGDGTRQLGVVYDQFLIGVVIARAELAAGRTPEVDMLTSHPSWRSRGTVIVAYPIDCEGHPNHPIAIRWRTSAQLPVVPTPIGEPVRGAATQPLLPGVALPDDALVLSLRNAPMIGASVEVDYENAACHGAAKTASFPLAETPSIALSMAFRGIKLPDDQASLPSPTTVRILVLLDTAGHPRFPQQMQGPPELGLTAIAALEGRTFPPAMMNGVPILLSTLVPFVFTTTGAPTNPDPYVPQAPSGNQVSFTRSVTTTVPASATTPPPVVPSAPPGQLDSQLARLAVETAQAGEAVPIPLDAAGPARHGVLFDRFLVGVVKARAAIAGGAAIDPATAPSSLVREDLIAVAFPIECSGRTVAPADIHISIGGASPGPLRDTGSATSGAALEARLPGVRLPNGAVGRTFVSAQFSQNLEVRVSYSDPACAEVALPIQWTRGTAIRRLAATKIPDGVAVPSPMTVEMRGLVDLSGRYRFPTVADGPKELEVTAVVTAADWQFQPYRANGVPTPTSVIAPLMFTTTGMPPAPGNAAPAGAAGGGPPPSVTMATTVGGRSTEDFTTPDEVGLSAITSRCAMAPDPNYGLTQAGAIKTGGGARLGPSREKQYLAVLRGPAGQGLRVVRRGSLMGPDRETILDQYELTYPGLASPILLYLDEYHDGTLQAPEGLVCAQAIVVK